MNGTIGNAAVTSTGEGDIYVVGTTTSVAVDSSGDGDIKLRNANGNAYHITSAPLSFPPPVALNWLEIWLKPKPQKGCDITNHALSHSNSVILFGSGFVLSAFYCQ